MLEKNTHLVEFFSDSAYEEGTVVIFGGLYEITASTTVNDNHLAGVIAYSDENIASVVLLGRTKCKVVGRVKKGDLLTTANTTGCAVKAIEPKLGAIVGKSLQDKDFGEAGLIEIVVI